MSMSKLARVLALVATLAAINLVGVTAVAQAHVGEDPASKRHRALGQVEVLATAAQQRAAADASVRRLLAREGPHSTSGNRNSATQQAQGQERYYSTWDYGDTSAPVPPESGGQAGWLTPVLGVLAAVLALVAGVAVLAARRATRSHRAGQTA
jgi:hypothetical protein